jgi:hypothetical protein
MGSRDGRKQGRMLEHKELHGITSWRAEWTGDDVEKALAYAGLKGWTYDNWSDGDMQFMHCMSHKDPVSFDDLAKLRITFTPLRMIIEAVVDSDADDAQRLVWDRAGSNPLHRTPTPLMVLVTMSWNEISDPEAV